MESTKTKFGMKIVVAILATLLISSTAVILFNGAPSTVSAATPSIVNALSNRINPATGQAYGDLAQYEWPRSALTWAQGDLPQMTRFSNGPAPSTPNVLWSLDQESKANATGSFAIPENNAQIGIPVRGMATSFIGGYVIILSLKNTTQTGYGAATFGAAPAVFKAGTVYAINALNPYTGALVWQLLTPGNLNLSPQKVDDTHFKLSVTDTVNSPLTRTTWMIYNINDGTFAFNVTNAPSTNNIFYDVKVAVSTGTGPNGTGSTFNGWDLTNLATTHVVPLMWNFTNPGGGTNTNCYGDGCMYLISWGDEYIRALNVTTGILQWDIVGPTNLRDCLFYNHKVYCAGIGQFLITYDSATGKQVWRWDSDPRAYFANGGCAGNGMFFSTVIATPQSYFAAWDDATGKLLWKIPAAYYIGYFSPVAADGKVYTVMSDGQGVSGLTYLPNAYSACLDAFTGATIWTVPYTFGTGGQTATGGFRGDLAIAYGSFWFEKAKTLYCINDLVTTSYSSMWMQSATSPGIAPGAPAPSNIAYPAWAYKTNGPVISSPVVVNGILYEGSEDHNIYALNATTGAKIWSFETGYKVRSTVAVVGGTVYTGTDDGSMYALNALTGAQIWKKTNLEDSGKWMGYLEFVTGSQGIYRSSPIVVGNNIYVGSLNGRVYCISASDGSTQWSYQTGGPVAGSAAYDSSGNDIYIASTEVSTGKLYAFDASSGTLLWNLTIAGSGNGLFATPCIAGDVIFMGGGASTAGLFVVNKATGTFTTYANGTQIRVAEAGTTYRTYTPVYFNGEVWNTTAASPSLLNTPQGVLFVSGQFRMQMWNVSAILTGAKNYARYNGSLAQGAQIWQQWLGHEVYGSPLITTGQDGVKVYIGADIGSITCFDAGNGKVLSNFATQGRVQSTPAVYNDMVYAGHSNFYIYAFGTNPTVATTIGTAPSVANPQAGQSISIDVRLFTQVTYTDPSQGIIEQYYPAIQKAPVTITVTKPDSTTEQLTATTDNTGSAIVSYTPTAAGNYAITAKYQGAQFLSYSYSPSISTAAPFTVAGSTATPTPSQTTAPTSTPSAEVTPTATPTTNASTDYTYVIVAVVVVIILLAIGAYVYMQRRKK